MSSQGTWADAIIIMQAVANCLNLSINIAESNETFAPVTVVQPINMTSCRMHRYLRWAHKGNVLCLYNRKKSQYL